MTQPNKTRSLSDAISALIDRILAAVSRLVTQIVLVILQGTGV
jgi:hypothetical protein